MLDAAIIEHIARGVSVSTEQVAAAINLFNAGGTIPFIARYRKDRTKNLNETQLEEIYEANTYFSALVQRRKAVIANIEAQGKLTDELRTQIETCLSKAALEDIYLPYKRKRKTRATAAREKGLEPLADYILEMDEGGPPLEEFAAGFVSPEKKVASIEEALAGARDIIAERVSEHAAARALVREIMQRSGAILAAATKLSDGKKTKYEAYYEFKESLRKIPSHRFLAILRGVREGMLRMDVQCDDDSARNRLLELFLNGAAGQSAEQVRNAVLDAYARLLRPSIESEVIAEVRAKADEDAIRVFRENARSLLMAPPAGPIPVLGIDPGIKSGCKAAVVDAAGAYRDHAVLNFANTEEAEAAFIGLIHRHNVQGIGIGNGTGSRQAMDFAAGVLQKNGLDNVFSVVVNEAGASVYSASRCAREEFPDLDVTIRGAVSIARRLQDPLAELVKIEPRSIGVGQYQHDVNQRQLREGLHRTVVSCVNSVGVDVNTASVALLRYVAGIQYGTAQNIVAFRGERGGFKNRNELLGVPGIGPKVFEQCAGFLRIRGGDNPLDETAIHPEAYPIVESLARTMALTTADIVRNRDALKSISLEPFVSDTAGALALEDIRSELINPGRDPRKEFRVPKFAEGIRAVTDLQAGMIVEGIVTNVTDFGAFVDIGVHQDGLVHLSQLANRFVNDPRQVVHVGDIVKVKVIAVDLDPARISLSMKALDGDPARGRSRRKPKSRTAREDRPKTDTAPAPRRDGAKKPREKRNREKRPQRERPAMPPNDKDSGPLNTQLAEQLAGLRERLSR